MLIGLCTLSIPYIRHRWYSLFYRLHIPLYIAYLGTCFWHAKDLRDSWVYLWATLAIYLASVLGRAFGKWQSIHWRRTPWLQGWPATVTVGDGERDFTMGGLTRLVIRPPRDFTWRPGQHVWLRIPHISWLQQHPFTIASLPSNSLNTAESSAHEMVFLVRSHSGLTCELLELAAAAPQAPIAANEEKQDIEVGAPLSVHVDGPYGGLVEDVSALYDTLVFVAGGSGISACLPHMLDTSRHISSGTSRVQKIHLLWMIRHPSQIIWCANELRTIVATAGADKIVIDVHITDTSAALSSGDGTPSKETASIEELNAMEKDMGLNVETSASMKDIVKMHHGRPFLPDVLPPLLSGRRIMFFGKLVQWRGIALVSFVSRAGCGPKHLRADLANAASRAQRRVFSGHSEVVNLHTEAFGW